LRTTAGWSPQSTRPRRRARRWALGTGHWGTSTCLLAQHWAGVTTQQLLTRSKHLLCSSALRPWGALKLQRLDSDAAMQPCRGLPCGPWGRPKPLHRKLQRHQARIERPTPLPGAAPPQVSAMLMECLEMRRRWLFQPAIGPEMRRVNAPSLTPSPPCMLAWPRWLALRHRAPDAAHRRRQAALSSAHRSSLLAPARNLLRADTTAAPHALRPRTHWACLALCVCPRPFPLNPPPLNLPRSTSPRPPPPASCTPTRSSTAPWPPLARAGRWWTAWCRCLARTAPTSSPCRAARQTSSQTCTGGPRGGGVVASVAAAAAAQAGAWSARRVCCVCSYVCPCGPAHVLALLRPTPRPRPP
jgi:hypothetical protein